MNIRSTHAAKPQRQTPTVQSPSDHVSEAADDTSSFGVADRVKVGLFSAIPVAGSFIHGSRFVEGFTESHHESRFAMLNLVSGVGGNIGGTAVLLEYAQTGNKVGLWFGLGCLAASGITAACLVNEDNLHKYI